MDIEKLIFEAVRKNLNLTVKNISHIGKGASGSVYCVSTDSEPKRIAVKVSDHSELLHQEFEMLSFLKEKTKSKIPAVYFFDNETHAGVLAMEFIDGISGTDNSLRFSFRKKHLA